MNKIIVSSIIIASMLFLSSCSLGGSRTEMLNKANDDKKADARLEQVLQTIRNKDKDALKSMFSKQALDEANDFDGSMDYLFELFQGAVASWKSNGGAVYETNEHGHKTKKFNSMYYVNTDKQKYIFYLIEWTVDTEHPDNVGLYTLRVIKAEDKDTQSCYFRDMKPGIYKPKEPTKKDNHFIYRSVFYSLEAKYEQIKEIKEIRKSRGRFGESKNILRVKLSGGKTVYISLNTLTTKQFKGLKNSLLKRLGRFEDKISCVFRLIRTVKPETSGH